jgi:peptidyl-prolyl cis-trans isomerase D
MQIIQNIRDKGAAIVIAVIALSLIGFLLMDAQGGGNRLFGASNTTIVGKVNGEAIEIDEFNKRVKEQEAQMEAQGRPVAAAQRGQIRNSAWEGMISEKIFYDEAKKLGIALAPKELTAVIYSADDAPQILKQTFTDPKTGQYDIEKVQQWWANAKKAKNEQRVAIESQVIEPIKLESAVSKYASFIAAAAYYPAWMQESDSVEKSSFATISYVAIPFSVITDSTIKVTDDEITAYVQKHKTQYEKDQETRTISFVSYSSNPSAADSQAVYNNLLALKDGFIKDSSAKAYAARNGSTMPFYDGYVLKSKMQMAMKDSIAALGKGGVFGPYLDGTNYVIARMVDIKTVPDSVKCRHILIKIGDAQNQQIRPDSVARKLIDSIATAIKGGADFDQMVQKYSDDGGSKGSKGEYKFSSSSSLVDSFYRTVFYEPVGTKKIVKGESGGEQGYIGYHYIEVMQQWKQEPAYQVAYLSKDILASPETINKADQLASKLSAEARNLKSFNEYTQKNGIQKITGNPPINENDDQVGSLQDARELVRWVYSAKQGEVSTPFRLPNQIVVAVLEEIQPKGLPSAKAARAEVERLILNEKKAAIILKKITNTPTLESAAAAYSKTVETAGADSSITFNSPMINGIGNEPKVVGAAFNKEWQTKVSPPIIGTNGVYVIKVNGYGAKAADPAQSAGLNNSQQLMSLKQKTGNWFQGLKKQAEIKDNRSKFF